MLKIVPAATLGYIMTRQRFMEKLSRDDSSASHGLRRLANKRVPQGEIQGLMMRGEFLAVTFSWETIGPDQRFGRGSPVALSERTPQRSVVEEHAWRRDQKTRYENKGGKKLLSVRVLFTIDKKFIMKKNYIRCRPPALNAETREAGI
ncbi:hypothetical protein F2P81_008117 [Scophthalmus maximus]|uniref:Uncharacterized protein n=1 Tax=Scophthalmus maximus TaxID=52904 RepID=A0A6A4TCG9_SCOMX|nr:hypothetical protein F2P81_008117 [Scophthalmus maximus]